MKPDLLIRPRSFGSAADDAPDELRRRMTVHAPARVTLDPPSSQLPESVVSVGELGLSYQVLEDWSDD